MDDLIQRIDELEQVLAQIAGCASHPQEPLRRLAAIRQWASSALIPEPERSMVLVTEEWDS